MSEDKAKEVKATKKAVRPLYKVGDYITRDDWVLLRVDVVISEDQSNPLYACWNPKSNKLDWHTEYELKQQKVKRSQPDYEKWQTVATGDVIHCGVTADRRYCNVLARVGNAVMLSHVPPTRQERDTFAKIAEQLEELTDGGITAEDMKEKVGMPETAQDAYKSAANDWWTIEKLALMNWELVKGDE